MKYNDDGSIPVTVVDGSTPVGVYASDGSANVFDATAATDPVGAYHASGAYNVSFATSASGNRYANNGSWNVSLNNDDKGTWVRPDWISTYEDTYGSRPFIVFDFVNRQFYFNNNTVDPSTVPDLANVAGTSAGTTYSLSTAIPNGPWTLYAEATSSGNATPPVLEILVKIDNGNTNRAQLYRNAAGECTGLVVTGGETQALLGDAAWAASTTAKIALAVATNDVAQCFNGGTVLTDTTATLPTGLVRFLVGTGTVAGSQFWNGTVNKIVIFNTRLTNTQLQNITT